MNSIIFIMAYCLILTIIIETIFSKIIFKIKNENIIYVILVNIMTNPLVESITFYISMYYRKTIYYIVLTIMELFALFSEAYVYKKCKVNKKAMTMSLILNLISFSIGEILNLIIFKKGINI